MERLVDGRLETFLEVNPSQHRRNLANVMAPIVAGKLGIPTPRVRFFYRDTFTTNLGYTYDNEIFVAADLDDMLTLEVIVHEARHLYQHSTLFWQTQDQRSRERDARLYGLAWPR